MKRLVSNPIRMPHQHPVPPTNAMDARSFRRAGCSQAEYLEIKKTAPRAVRAYQSQERNARGRGIAFELNLWQWWTAWQESGHWADRGAGQGYVMCRYGDVGPYAVGNIYIATNSQNIKDGLARRYASNGSGASA